MKHFISLLSALLLLTLCSNNANAQGVLTNGWTYNGTIATAGQSNTYTFTANSGDSMVVGMGVAVYDVSSLYPNLRLYGPDGVLLASGDGGNSTEVTTRATNSGTFTVVAANYDPGSSGGTGPYTITLGKTGSAIVVAPGSQGGTLTNGFTYPANLRPGQLNVWSFTANTGDSMVVGMGVAVYDVSSLYPYLRLYGPDGVLLTSGDGGNSTEVTTRATNSGTFTVVAANYDNAENGGNGTNRITLGKTGSAIVVAPGSQGGTLTNGFTYPANLRPGQLNVWSFTANAGDSMVVGMGVWVYDVSSLYPYLRLYGPDGVLLASGDGSDAAEVTTRATNSGTFTVVAANYDNAENGGNGTNRITLGKTGSAIVVAPGCQGGTLTNGYTYPENLLPGQLNVWSFTANTGDSMVVGMGVAVYDVSSLYPYLRLYGPDGVLLISGDGGNSTEVATRATNSGTFTVVAANYDNAENGGNGTNQITLGKTGSAIVVAPGDQGGSLNGTGAYNGTLLPGELNVWKFTICAGEDVVLEMSEMGDNNLYPYLRLYNPDGSLLNSMFGSSTALINLSAPVGGTFTLITANYDNAENGGNGNFQLTANGLSDGFKTCSPVIAGMSLDVDAIGGPPGTNAVLLTTTNLATPVALWTPVLTNQFDEFGVFDYTNGFNSTEPQRFFQLSYP